MDRRRLLMACLNTGSWEQYSQQYLYYTLIPQTINTKSVKNKAKISKIYGNGVIENQLSPQSNNGAMTGLTITRDGGTFTINGTTSSAGHYIDNQIAFTNGHKYFVYAIFKNYSQNNAYAGMQVYGANIVNAQLVSSQISSNGISGFFATATGTGNVAYRFRSEPNVTFTNTQVTPQLIDLTLMFGTGNEPTTLTDNRIQNILNRGYIPYNLGTYKESDIGVVSTTKADTTALDTITFKAQLGGAINSHNTMEITNSAYVFTRNVWKYTFNGSESFYYQNERFYLPQTTTLIPNIKLQNIGTMSNMVMPNFVTVKEWDALANSIFSNNNLIFFYVPSISQTSDLQTMVANKPLYYELATPQVITIPRKHLGIVKISDLSWGYQNGTFRPGNLTNAKQPSGYGIVPNAYCCPFNAVSNQALDSGANLSFSITDSSSSYIIRFRDTSITNVNDFINKYGDYYIFYETQDEVADIENVVDIESGGTITSNWFSWVENQMISPTMLRPTSSFTHNGITFSRDTTNATIHVYGLCSGAMTIDITDTLSITSGHKYLLNFTSGGSINTYHVVETVSNTKCIGSDLIKTLNSSTAKYGFYIANGQNIDITFKPQLVDLTVGFPDSDMPTNVNDPRIQYIINKGYIPTNTTGTLKSVATEVLPNTDLLIKCK